MAKITEKGWWLSSTVWINLGGILALVLDYIVRSGQVKDADIIAIILAVVNIVRRFQAPKVIEPLKLI